MNVVIGGNRCGRLQQNVSLDLCATCSCCCQLSSGSPHTSSFIILSVILIDWSCFSKTGKANRLVMPTSTITAISLNLAFLKFMFSGQTFDTSFTINKCIPSINWTCYPFARGGVMWPTAIDASSLRWPPCREIVSCNQGICG